MRRGVQEGTETSPGREPSRALALRHSPARQRLCALEREHARLLNEIRKKKLAREATENTARDAARALDARLGPLREALSSTLAELRAIFASLLGPDSRLNRRDKVRVRRAYGQLLDQDDAESAQASGGCSEQHGHAPGAAQHARASADAGYSAPRPKEKGPCLLRAVFRRLAIALHPDREQDPTQRATLTSVMKEVTRAYELGDVARLVELERSWLVTPSSAEPEQDLERGTELLLQTNQELRLQLRALSAEVKALRDSVAQSTLAPRAPSGRGARSRGSELGQDWLLGESERELQELHALRDFARAFLNGDVDLREFLLGPPLGFDEAPSSEQFLADALGAEFPCGSARRQRGRRTGLF